MNYWKGTIMSVRQHSGCVEVNVEGEVPGSFIIDNCCVWSIVDCEGTDWIGRNVEYDDGLLRFLDATEPVREVPPTSDSDVMFKLSRDHPSNTPVS